MTNNLLLTASHIRYLLALKKLNGVNGVKSSDIAKELNFTRPSIHNMMETFLFMKYIEKEPGGRVFLTEYGLQRADFFENYYLQIKEALFLNRRTDKSADLAIYAFWQSFQRNAL